MLRRFLYFVEGMDPAAPPRAWADRGLGYAFADKCAPSVVEIQEGPGGASGALAAVGSPEGLAYEPAVQEWQLAEAVGPGVWIGWPKDRKQLPGPRDLMRRSVCVEGYPVRLGDGNLWDIPVVRRAPNASQVNRTALPLVVKIGADGAARSEVRADYEGLWRMSLVLRDSLFGTVDAQGNVTRPDFVDPFDLLRLGALALAVNYRVGLYEVSALELIDTENAKEIGDAVLDGPNLKRFLDEWSDSKKNGTSPHGATSCAGAAASLDTCPPGLKSSSTLPSD